VNRDVNRWSCWLARVAYQAFDGQPLTSLHLIFPTRLPLNLKGPVTRSHSSTLACSELVKHVDKNTTIGNWMSVPHISTDLLSHISREWMQWMLHNGTLSPVDFRAAVACVRAGCCRHCTLFPPLSLPWIDFRECVVKSISSAVNSVSAGRWSFPAGLRRQCATALTADQYRLTVPARYRSYRHLLTGPRLLTVDH